MKKFIIAEICVLLALAGGFWLGRVTGTTPVTNTTTTTQTKRGQW